MAPSQASHVTASAAAPDDPLTRGGRRRWLLAAVWLVFLAAPASDAVHRNEGLLQVVGVLGIVAFSIAYLVTVPVLLHPERWRSRRLAANAQMVRAVTVVAMLALATSLLPLTGSTGLNAYVFVAVMAIVLFPTRLAIAWVVGEMLLALALELAMGWADPTGTVLAIALGSVAMFGVMGVIRRNRELAEAHRELARLAVEEERARFARDLHDLLGHSLTVIKIKSELARRLLEKDPARAATEIADIEQLSRDALADVRATVAGYREVSLASEVAAARSALHAAGIAADLPGAVDDVPGPRRELFGWVVREGVVNVVRHSHASRVRVSVTPTSVEIVDNGRGGADRIGAPQGSGLAGLAERVQAAGGHLHAGPVEGGGFRLCAEVPA